MTRFSQNDLLVKKNLALREIDDLLNNYFFIFTFSSGIGIFLWVHNYSLVSYLVDIISLFIYLL